MPRSLSPSFRRSLPATLPLVGLLLLLRANESLNHQELTIGICILLLVGFGSWLASLFQGHDDLIQCRPVPAVKRGRLGPHWLLVALAVSASAGAFYWASDNTYRTPGVICWIVSVLAWSLAWWPFERNAISRVHIWVRSIAGQPNTVWMMTVDARKVLLVVAVVLIVAVGAFFRLYQIDQTPLDPTSDHAEKLLDVTDVLAGKRPIFFERNTGREPMQFYFSAGLFRLFDLPTTFTSLKIGTALVGALAIPFVFLLAMEIGGRLNGVIAASLYAVCAWPVEIARAGLRFPYAPMATAPALWFFLRWMRTRDRRDALLCGISVGIGLHGYTPIRVVVPALMIGMAIALVDPARRALRRRTIGDGALIGITAGVVFVPLGRYAIEHPDMFWYRAAGRVTGDTDKGAVGVVLDNLSIFARNNLNAALGLNWIGDSTFVNAVSFTPMLDWVTGALLISGMTMVLVQIARKRDLRAIFIVVALPILLLSSTLAIGFPNENPSVNREGPAAPLIFALLALPLVFVRRRMRIVVGERAALMLTALLVALSIGTAAVQSFDEYFTDFDNQTRSVVANTTEIAYAIQGARSMGVDQNDAYVIDRAYWLDIRNVGIALGDITWGFTHNVLVDDPLPARLPDRPLLLIVNGDDVDRLTEIQRTFPDAIIFSYPAKVVSKRFFTVWIAGADALDAKPLSPLN